MGISHLFNEDSQAPVAKDTTQASQDYYGEAADGAEQSEHLRFWIGFSTACGQFHQFQLMRDATALWGTSIYARQQAAIREIEYKNFGTQDFPYGIALIRPSQMIITINTKSQSL
ncbi:MAG: hypothetical protein EZS28_020721 [Streblomastix strix]|uniref:Uncharacterized protein n=1 Tax=Streblomastix strix TaxID=222440 RepID=A0A5J4VMR2_9EUKA|nr:MAG: hypothetical protein EZS28_020721 [Streblomastix strix]